MEKLGRANYNSISRGVKTYGTYDPQEIFFIFEEELYMNEADIIWDFLEWCHANDLKFGRGNYEEQFTRFLESTKENVN